MATAADPTNVQGGDARFFARYTLWISLLIIFGFAQFTLRGFNTYAFGYIWPHVHGMLMLSWLGVMVMQTRFVEQGDIARHRRLGWIGAYLVAAVVASGCFAGIMALRAHVVPPSYTDAHFLALTQVSPIVFGGMVFAAITRRKQTDYHRRLMVGALVAITEPAFGRLLPMPLLGAWASWAELLCQLLLLGVLAVHDRKTIGRIHPATAMAGAIIAMTHVLVGIAAVNNSVIALAAKIAS